jgi:flagellar basal-body rod protein FlgF
MYISAEGAQAQSKRMEVIANNLANVNTPGFKRDFAGFRARFAEAIQQGLDQTGVGSINDVGGGVVVHDVQTDHSPGTLRNTGIPTDMAIDGGGYFKIQHGDEVFLTRAGNFQLTPAGQLITSEGYTVLSEADGPVLIDPEQGAWQLGPDGAVRQGGSATYLALVQPQSPGDLAKVGENLFRPLADVQAVPANERQLRQGFLEESGVNSTTEMMALIETSRAYEANVRLIQNQDQLISSLVNRVLGS